MQVCDTIRQVILDEDEKKARLVVSDKQLSLAIGKAGQNVRLAAKLTGYGIDIKSESQAENITEIEDDDQYVEPTMDTEVIGEDQKDQINNEVVKNESDAEESVDMTEDTEDSAGEFKEDEVLEDESEERKDEQ